MEIVELLALGEAVVPRDGAWKVSTFVPGSLYVPTPLLVRRVPHKVVLSMPLSDCNVCVPGTSLSPHFTSQEPGLLGGRNREGLLFTAHM